MRRRSRYWCCSLVFARRKRGAAATAGVLCALLAASGIARGETSVRIIEIDPGASATLGRTQPFSLRIDYTSGEPVVFSAQGSLQGRTVPAMNGGEPHRGPGQGEVLMWFAYYQAQQIDAVTVTAKTASGKVLAETALPVALSWTGQPTAWPAPAAWVQRLQAENERAAKARNQAMMNSPLMMIMDMVAMVLMWTVPGYFIAQGWLLWSLSGGWRTAAAAPLLPMGAVLVYTVYAFLDGSNIFPLVLIFTAPMAFIYLTIIAVLHWLI
jgi:hypothetical protein